MCAAHLGYVAAFMLWNSGMGSWWTPHCLQDCTGLFKFNTTRFEFEILWWNGGMVYRVLMVFVFLIWFLQPRLSDAAAAAVKQLLPDFAEGDLGSVCSWADRVRFRYHWSAPLHFIDTPDDLCNYQYTSKLSREMKQKKSRGYFFDLRSK